MAAARVMLRAAQCYSPSLSPVCLLRLKVHAQDPFTLPNVIFIATGMELIWTNRMKSVVTSLAAMRADLEARAARTTPAGQGQEAARGWGNYGQYSSNHYANLCKKNKKIYKKIVTFPKCFC